jgi:hypothetical protein
MQQVFIIIFILTTLNSFSQKLNITTIDKTKVLTVILDSESKSKLLTQFNGRQDNTLRKKLTARTFLLSDGKIVVEFFDKQAILIDNLDDLKKLDRIRFVKNTIDFLKKNISYKIEISNEESNRILETEKPKRLTNLKSDMPEYYDFKVYELSMGQFLLVENFQNVYSSTIYADLKTLCSENRPTYQIVYDLNDDEGFMKKLASGDDLQDYDVSVHLLYPKYLSLLIESHKLTLV